MRATVFATSALAALALGAAPALAQSSGTSSGGSSGQTTTSSSGQSSQSASQAMPKPMTQDKVNQVMKEAGFTNVTILDAAYLVQGTTKDGDQVLVMLNAPMMQAAAGRTGGTGSGASGTTGSGASGTSGTTPPKQ